MKKPLKVLLLNRNFSQTGGIAHVVLTFARHDDHRRLERHIASFKPFNPVMADALAQTGTAVHELGDARYLKPALVLRRVMKEQKINIVAPVWYCWSGACFWIVLRPGAYRAEILETRGRGCRHTGSLRGCLEFGHGNHGSRPCLLFIPDSMADPFRLHGKHAYCGSDQRCQPVVNL